MTRRKALGAFDADLMRDMRETREHLHRFPELSFQEHETSAYLMGRLAKYGITTRRYGKTGFVAQLTNGVGPVVAFRADMDGLPVREETGFSFSSERTADLDGQLVPVMHACGHDVHMSVAFGAARYLIENADAWAGTVLLIFQPAEEIAAGAQDMLGAGMWEELAHPEVVYGLHVMPYEAGRVFVPVGTAMSMGDSWRVTVRGRSAHGSQPEQSIDPIVLGAAMVLRLQTVVSREVGPKETAVVTIGTFHAGLKENIIPEMAEFSLNVRTYDPVVRERVLGAIRRIVNAEAAASGAPEPLIEVLNEFPECYNDPASSERLIDDLKRELGSEAAGPIEPHMASEDFGYFGSAIGVPSVYWFVGGTPARSLEGSEPVAVNHSPRFAPVSDPTLEVGLRSALVALLGRVGL